MPKTRELSSAELKDVLAPSVDPVAPAGVGDDTDDVPTRLFPAAERRAADVRQPKGAVTQTRVCVPGPLPPGGGENIGWQQLVASPATGYGLVAGGVMVALVLSTALDGHETHGEEGQAGMGIEASDTDPVAPANAIAEPAAFERPTQVTVSEAATPSTVPPAKVPGAQARAAVDLLAAGELAAAMAAYRALAGPSSDEVHTAIARFLESELERRSRQEASP